VCGDMILFGIFGVSTGMVVGVGFKCLYYLDRWLVCILVLYQYK
jgi:hypothetical protein